MNIDWAIVFMALQCVTCFGGAIGFATQKNWPLAWVWLSYSSANIGFAIIAMKG